jgi:hypothetical protein
MISKFRSVISAAILVAGTLIAMPGHAIPLGNLDDGLVHVGSQSGYWSLDVNSGDVITVIARRLQATDIWSFVALADGGAQCQGAFQRPSMHRRPNLGRR